MPGGGTAPRARTCTEVHIMQMIADETTPTQPAETDRQRLQRGGHSGIAELLDGLERAAAAGPEGQDWLGVPYGGEETAMVAAGARWIPGR